MSLKNFLTSLVPHFERNRIVEDIDSLTIDLKTNLIPSYESANKLLAGRKFASHAGQSMEAMYRLRMNQMRNMTHLQFISVTQECAVGTLAMLENLVPEIFARDVTKDSLTYKKAAVLQLLSVIRFYNDFAGRHLLRLLAAEDAIAKGQPEDADLLPIDQKFFAENLETFLQAALVVSYKPAEIAERLGAMEDIQIVADKIATVSSTLGQENVDPFKLNFMGPSATNSLIYKLRASVANYQVAAYNQNKELAKGLQLRLYSLKDAQSGKNDPKLQHQIELNTDRLQRLREEIANFEERYG